MYIELIALNFQIQCCIPSYLLFMTLSNEHLGHSTFYNISAQFGSNMFVYTEKKPLINRRNITYKIKMLQQKKKNYCHWSAFFKTSVNEQWNYK